jgi:4-amino-4-deoxy-L-arabinose transferase-like glycosyltransferase
VVTESKVSLPMVSDASEYFSYAYNLRHFGVYSDDLTWAGEPPPGGLHADSLRTPGYPLFLLAIPGLDTSAAWVARVQLVQAALGVASVWLVYLLARRFLRAGWAHAAALLAAISPHLANLNACLLSEGLFLFLLLCSLLASVEALRKPHRWRFALAGLAWGACALVRPSVLLLPPLLLLGCWLAPRLRDWRAPALLLVAVFLAVQAPWFLRNRVTPMDPGQGSLLVWSIHHGSYPDFMYEGRPETLGWPFRADPRSLEAERSMGNLGRDLAAKFRAQPAAMLRWYLLGKPGALLSWGFVQGHDIYVYEVEHSPYAERPAFAALRLVSLLLHWPLMLAGLAAAGVAWWRPRWLGLEGEALVAARVLAAVVLYAIAFHLVVAPYPRYGVPFRPLLFALALAWPAALKSKNPGVGRGFRQR